MWSRCGGMDVGVSIGRIRMVTDARAVETSLGIASGIAPTAAQKWAWRANMRHCSSCAYCILDIKALRYCGVIVDKCKLTGNLVLTPFIDGIMCKCYKKRFATPEKRRKEESKNEM